MKEVGEDEIASKHDCVFEEYLQPKTYIVHFLTSSSNAAVSNDAVRYSLSLTGRKKRA